MVTIRTDVHPVKPENCVFANYDDIRRSYFCMFGKKKNCVNTKKCKYLNVKKGAEIDEREN